MFFLASTAVISTQETLRPWRPSLALNLVSIALRRLIRVCPFPIGVRSKPTLGRPKIKNASRFQAYPLSVFRRVRL